MSCSTLAVNGLRFDVRIGWTPDERLKEQPIDIDVFVRFAEAPPACKTDELAGTICYSQLCEAIEGYCAKRSFRLLEHLAYELHGVVREQAPKDARVLVRVRKIHPPIPRLLGGAAFSYGDWQE